MDARRLILGDWTPLVRDGIDVLRLVILGSAVGYAASERTGAAALLAALGAVSLLARLVNLPRAYDCALTCILILQGFGEGFGLYDASLQIDDVMRLTLPILTAPIVYIALARLDVVPDPRDETHFGHYVGIFVVTAALGGAIIALWDVYAWWCDAALGTRLSGTDEGTNGDLVRGISGSLIGAGVVIVWAYVGWGSVRRIPGVNTHEDIDSTNHEEAEDDHFGAPRTDAWRAARQALMETVREGSIAIGGPAQMRQGSTESVSVSVSPDTGDAERLRQALSEYEQVDARTSAVSPVMRVTCGGEGFTVTTTSAEDQLVIDGATWHFRVRADKIGKRTLLISVSLRLPTEGAWISRPALSHVITVTVDPIFSTTRFLRTYWQWVLTVLLGAAATITAWQKLFEG